MKSYADIYIVHNILHTYIIHVSTHVYIVYCTCTYMYMYNVHTCTCTMYMYTNVLYILVGIQHFLQIVSSGYVIIVTGLYNVQARVGDRDNTVSTTTTKYVHHNKVDDVIHVHVHCAFNIACIYMYILVGDRDNTVSTTTTKYVQHNKVDDVIHVHCAFNIACIYYHTCTCTLYVHIFICSIMFYMKLPS